MTASVDAPAPAPIRPLSPPQAAAQAAQPTRWPRIRDFRAEVRHCEILGHLLYTAKLVAKQEGLDDGFRLVINDGPNGSLIAKGNIIISNAGDCRAVCSRGGVAEALTSDHRPSRQDEQDRIEVLALDSSGEATLFRPPLHRL
ncbi:14 kDa zinc-binding protein [Phtheirospermum japonicum]|uniref:14 kDa zinc-binding protein n=1 Tax=Phtheirospermum japonicum TaxID=374723 RepID=A0A830C881_9LAMI|nr:14 kDa zinc-binding protein [Phtheirospermum japonicum]